MKLPTGISAMGKECPNLASIFDPDLMIFPIFKYFGAKI